MFILYKLILFTYLTSKFAIMESILNYGTQITCKMSYSLDQDYPIKI